MKFILLVLLIQFISENDAAAINEELRQLLEEMHLQQAAERDTGPEGPYEKIGEDMHCVDEGTGTPTNQGNIPFLQCKKECRMKHDCNYIAYWMKTKKCMHYATCYTKVPSSTPKKVVKVGLHRKVIKCEERLLEYNALIAQEFLAGVIRPLKIPFEWEAINGEVPKSIWPNPNFYCKCVNAMWMICGIFSTIGTANHDLLLQKFLGDEESMLPFSVQRGMAADYGGEPSFIIFRDALPDNYNSPYAEMQNLPFNPAYQYHNNGCMTLEQCLFNGEARCPVTKKKIESGDPVYILRDDTGLVRHGRNVRCVTVVGMRILMLAGNPLGLDPSPADADHSTFMDPLGRSRVGLDGEIKREFTIPTDYAMYFVFDEAAWATGICNAEAVPGLLPPGAPKNIIQLAAAQENEDSQEDSGPSGGKKKKKKKKKKPSSIGAGSSTDPLPQRNAQDESEEEIHPDVSVASMLGRATSRHKRIMALIFLFLILTACFPFCSLKSSSQQNIYVQFP